MHQRLSRVWQQQRGFRLLQIPPTAYKERDLGVVVGGEEGGGISRRQERLPIVAAQCGYPFELIIQLGLA